MRSGYINPKTPFHAAIKMHPGGIQRGVHSPCARQGRLPNQMLDMCVRAHTYILSCVCAI